jgi:hypothetical protein
MVIVHTLGKALIDAGTMRVTPASVRKFALLLYLSAEPGRRVPRSVLRDLIFPDQSEKNARHSLRELVYQLRQSGVEVDSDTDGIAICREGVQTAHVQLIGRDRLDTQDLTAAEGGLLPGYAPTHSEAFGEWFEGYRARTSFAVCKRLLREVDHAKTIGEWSTAELAARACLALDPMNEEGTLALAEMLAIGGAKAQAVKLLDGYVAELGSSSKELRLPTALVKRRITDQLGRAGRQHSSMFVGRSSEMLQLHEKLELVKHDQTQCVLIHGDPGIGKSRLLSEFRTVAVLDGAVSAIVVMQPNDAHRPFGAFADLLPSLLAMRGALGCAPESLRSLERLAKVPQSGLSDADIAAGSDDLCDSVTCALIDLIDAIASEQVVVLAIEDVNWMDEMSARVLRSLLSGAPRRILALVTTRRVKGLQVALTSATSLTTINVQRLNALAVRDMTAFLTKVSQVPLDDIMRQWLQDTSDGNPLFLESLFAHYAKTRERFAIPPTLTALLDRRIEMLSREAATVLKVCALLGKHSSVETVAHAIELPRFALLRAIAELEESGLIKAEGTCVRPSHALIADVAHRKAGVVENQVAHRCVAIALEHLLTTEHGTAVLWDCADHWILAQNSERALRAIGVCSRYAVDIGRPGEAAGILARALTLDLRREDRVATARQMVLAADDAGESALVSRGLQELRLLGVADEHDNVEFADFRDRVRTFQDAPGGQERMLRCASATTAPAPHRIAAATLILKYADIHGELEFAADAIAAGSQVLSAVPEKERLEFILVRDCVLGEWDAAARSAMDFLALVSAEPVRSRFKGQLNAAAALWRSGFPSHAVQAATLAYFDAQAGGSLRLALTAATLAADLCFELDDDQAGRLWVDRALANVSTFPDLANHYSLALGRVTAEIRIGELAEARSLFHDARSRGLFDGSRLRERWKKTLEAWLCQPGGEVVLPPEEIDRVSRDVDAIRPMSGILEFEVATACKSLLGSGRCLEARQLCDRLLASDPRTRAGHTRIVRTVNRVIDEAIRYRLSVRDIELTAESPRSGALAER